MNQWLAAIIAGIVQAIVAILAKRSERSAEDGATRPELVLVLFFALYLLTRVAAGSSAVARAELVGGLVPPEERSTAVRAARIMGLNVAGVDLLRSNHGPLVMEVNSSPGLEGIEGATGKDIAGMIIEFLEKNAKKDKTRTRGKG